MSQSQALYDKTKQDAVIDIIADAIRHRNNAKASDLAMFGGRLTDEESARYDAITDRWLDIALRLASTQRFDVDFARERAKASIVPDNLDATEDRTWLTLALLTQAGVAADSAAKIAALADE